MSDIGPFEERTYIHKAMCPYCGFESDLTTDLTHNAPPEEGDVALCIKCAEVTIYGKDLQQRKPTDEELEVLVLNPMVVAAQEAVREFIDAMEEARKADRNST